MQRILVVDDEPLISMLLEDWLVELGHEVVGPVTSSAEALALIEERSPDAAILDVLLGGDDSSRIADALATRGVPFALATGQDPSFRDARYHQAPVLAKPFDFAAVSAMLSRLLGPPAQPVA